MNRHPMTDLSGESHLLGALNKFIRGNWTRFSLKGDESLVVDTPFMLPDGSACPITFSMLGQNTLLLSDGGATLRAMGYECRSNVAVIQGQAWHWLNRTLESSGGRLQGDTLLLPTGVDEVGRAVFRFVQMVARVCNLSLILDLGPGLGFYNDLAAAVKGEVGLDCIDEEYRLIGPPHAVHYPIDYRIHRGDEHPIYLFGVGDTDKARLATVTLLYLREHASSPYHVLIVLSADAGLSADDMVRLCEAAGDGLVIQFSDKGMKDVLSDKQQWPPKDAEQQ